jgi:hypothetical protein
MRKFITLGFMLMLCIGLKAQTSLTRLHGAIKNTDGNAVEAASVTLLTPEKKIAKVAVSDKKGDFELLNIKPGSYIITISAVGYKPYASKEVLVAAGTTDLPIEVPAMALAEKELSDVTVTGRKQIVETKIDRMVVNVDAMISNAGSTVLEVLEKSPGILVDRDGNISLKGKQGVMVLIDGRPSYLSGADLANVLRNMPSNQIDQIEIMTQPPAKYDASGNAGLINIKTKKNKANGFNGSVSLSYIQGVYPKSPNSINLNWRRNKVNMFMNYGYSYWEGFNELSIARKFGNGNGGVSSVFDQVSDGKSYGRNHNFKVGMDYNATAKTTLGVVVTGNFNPSDNYTDSKTYIYTGDYAHLDSINTATSHNDGNWKNIGVNLNGRRTLKKKGEEISADLDFLWYGNSMFQDNHNQMTYPDGTPTQLPFLLTGDLPSDIKIYSFKTDYTLPLKGQASFEAGIKSSLVNTDNNAIYNTYNHGKGQWEDDYGRSNHFLYDENINAAYINYRNQIKKWGIQAGLRLENTNGKGKQLANHSEFTRHYTQLFPTLYISNKLDEKNTLSLSYGRRIERPSYQDMNPFQYFLDQFTYRQGNPYLLPQFTHNVELMHSFKGALTTTLNYTYTKDIINDILKQNDSSKVTFLTKDNIGERTNIGLAISYNAPITKWYTISFYTNGYHNHFIGTVNGMPLDVSLFSYMANINNQFRFGKTWGAELSGFYRSKMQDAGITLAQPMGTFNLAFSKQIMKGKGSLRLVVNDPFYIMRFRGVTKFDNIDATVNVRWDNRRVGLTFVYRFGKQIQQAASSRRRGSASEEQQRVGSSTSGQQ